MQRRRRRRFLRQGDGAPRRRRARLRRRPRPPAARLPEPRRRHTREHGRGRPVRGRPAGGRHLRQGQRRGDDLPQHLLGRRSSLLQRVTDREERRRDGQGERPAHDDRRARQRHGPGRRTEAGGLRHPARARHRGDRRRWGAVQAGPGLLQRPRPGARHLHLQAQRRLERDRRGHRPVRLRPASDRFRPRPAASASTPTAAPGPAHLHHPRHDAVSASGRRGTTCSSAATAAMC